MSYVILIFILNFTFCTLVQIRTFVVYLVSTYVIKDKSHSSAEEARLCVKIYILGNKSLIKYMVPSSYSGLNNYVFVLLCVR